MSERNGYVRYPALIGFSLSILGVIVTLAIWGANCVIANDRMRETEDNKLEAKIEVLLKENWEDHRQIMMDLREIKTKMGIVATQPKGESHGL